MVKKNKKQTKIEQANMQSDNIEMSAWNTEDLSSNGVELSGPDDFSYSFADLDEDFARVNPTATVGTSYTVDGINFDYDDEELRKKYPALQDAWNHYKNVKHMCEQKEKENED